MVTRITSSNIEPGSITTDRLASGVSGGPKIVNVVVADSSYNVLDDTAISTSGGYVRITGSGFNTGCSVLVGNSVATSTSFISSNFLNAQLPALPAGTYPMYVVNPDGATAIRVNAITYSLTPTWITGSTLPSQVVDASFSLQLNATSNSSVVYSVASGSSLPAGVTLSSAGLLSGTVTGLAQDTVFSFIIEATDAENQESPRTFSVTISAGDGNINQTMLLLQADTETFITDASDNKFTVTPVDSTRPSSFSPYNTRWSLYQPAVDASYLNFGSGDWTFGGDFTIDAWVYYTSASSGDTSLYVSTNGSTYFAFNISMAAGVFNIYLNSSSPTSSISHGINANEWTHVAMVRDSNTITLYTNGVSKGTIPSSTTVGYNNPTVNRCGGGTTGVERYISNLRILKGSAVVGVPTAPHSPSTTNQILLTASGNRFADFNTAIDAKTVTVTGSPAVSNIGPFAETATTTGSAYFDGNGDYLTVPSGSHFADFGTDDFTVEWWEFITAWPSQYFAIIHYGSLGDTGNFSSRFGIRYEASGARIRIGINGSYYDFDSLTTNLKEWRHCAIVRSNGVVSLYRNGIFVNSQNISTDIAQLNGTSIIGGAYFGSGGGTLYSNNGYLSDLHIVKGTSLYSQNFEESLSTSNLTKVAGTSILTLQNRIGYNNSQPIDLSGLNHALSRPSGTNSSVGSFSPYLPTGWSVHLATDRSVSFTGNTSTTLDGDFTFETWVYLTSYDGGGYNELTILTDRSGTSVGTNIDISNSNAASPGTFGLWNNGSTTFVTSSAGDVPLNVWTHLAITREGTGTNNLKAFINGVLKAQTTSTATFFGTNTMYIGDSMYNQQFNNYLSNMRMIKGRALYTTSAVLDTAVFTPPAYTLSPTEDTSFLLFRDGNYITDSGPQRLTITPGASAPIAVAFSPFKPHTVAPDSYSVYFDGTGDYLQLASSTAFNMNTYACIEAWVNYTALGTSTLIAGRDSSYWIAYNFSSLGGATNKFVFSIYNGSTWSAVSSTTTPQVNEWYHVVGIRDNSTLKIYVDGDLENTAPLSGTPVTTSNVLGIGANQNTQNMTGYISNLRFVFGSDSSVLPYTSNFDNNLPTAALTAVSGTSLLTCQSPTVIDNSTNAFAITVNGNTQPTRFNPFGETVSTGVEYSPISHGGSVYFDGTEDYLKAPHSEDLTFRNGDFTIEFWLYLPSTIPGGGACFLTKGWGSYAPYLFYSNGSSMVFYSSSNGSSWDISSAQVIGALKLGTWMHICVSRKGTSIKGFMDGVQGFSITTSATLLVNTTTVTINAADNGFSGIIAYNSGLRMIKGRSIYNNQSFVPPQAPVDPIPGTTLLTCTNNAAVYDATGRHVLETIGTVRVSNNEIKYGTGAMYFDGSSGSLLSPFRDEFSFGTGDFTVEGWFYFNDLATSARPLVGLGDGANGSGPIYTSWLLQYLGSDGSNQLRFYRYDGTSYAYVTAGLTLSANVWTHIAASRTAGTLKIFVNGQSYYSNTVSQTFAAINTNPLRVGLQYYGPAAGYGGPRYFNGYMDDIRITKGVGRYDLPFDPPGKHLAR